MATEILPSRETLPVLSVYTTLNTNALYKGRCDFGDALTRSSWYFKSVTDIVANILTHIFYHYFHSYFSVTKGKVTVIVTIEETHLNAKMQVTLIKYRDNGWWAGLFSVTEFF